MAMLYRTDRNGNELSMLGFGCMRFTRKGRKTDLEKAEKEILRAYELGVNYFDTAYVYDDSEATIGEIFERNHMREKIHIATKLPQYLISSRAAIDRYFDEELSRLRTGYVDYYLMHHLTDIVQWEKLQKIGIDRSRKMFKDIYAMIGNEIQTFIVGGAPMDPEIIRDFRALGINMFEGYGLTETSPIIAVNADYRQKTGTVGPPMPGTQVRIADPDEDGIGEIQALTESTMIGYYQDPEETAKVLLPDGWFATGDYGFLDKEGFLHVTGRKKNVIVTKNGKNIYPEELEYLLDKSEYIKESVVWGKEDPDGGDLKITAEIVIDTEALQGKTPEEIQALIDGEVERVNAATTSYKRIKRFNIREEEFEKTTTRKIRRHTIDYK